MSDTLEMRVKVLEEQNKALQKRLAEVEDIEAIKILTRCYGYYYEHGMGQELTDLYADVPDVALHWLGQGSFVGKETIKKVYDLVEGFFGKPGGIHCILMNSGIIHVAPDGKTAKGRWYGLMPPMGAGGGIAICLYNIDYLKQHGKWKIKMLEHSFAIDPMSEDTDPEKAKQSMNHMSVYPYTHRNTEFHPWHPSGYIRPFHFNHPVTGKPTSEDKRNESLKSMKNVESYVKKI